MGDQITVRVSRDVTSLPNKAYVLNNKQDKFSEYKTDKRACMMAGEDTSCIFFSQFAKRDRVGNIDVVFVGDANYSSIERKWFCFFYFYSTTHYRLPSRIHSTRE